VFNLFFVAEAFAAILIAHGTHGHSQKSVSGAPGNSRPKAESGEEVPGEETASWWVWEHCKLPQWGSGQSPD